ncbi:ABC transporter substrate-binding protein [Streptomyces pratensis]|uniref:hypothetical protein n=1 Tax=Streptomyces pratensis TaxID=1169025 RepID=UPI003643053C
MAPYSPPSSHGIARPVVSATPLTLCALALGACGSSGDEAESADAGASVTTQVTDAARTKVKIPAAPGRAVALSGMDLDASLAPGVEPVGLTARRGQKGAPRYLAGQAKSIPVVGAVTGPDIEKVVQAEPDVILAGRLADEQVLAQLRNTAPTVVTIDGDRLFIASLDPGTGLLDQPAGKPACRQLGAVRDKHATVIDGTRWTGLGGAQAAVPVLDDIRKAMVK